MPPRKPVIPTKIPYQRQKLNGLVAYMEGQELEKIEEIADQEKYDQYIDTNQATEDRRAEQRKDHTHIADFDDVKRYLSLKIRDKESKIRFYQNKLKETRQEREDLIAKLQAEHEQLKQSHELELTQLTNTLKANKQRRDALATVAALEIQLKRETDEAEATLKREKAQQSQQTSNALAEYYQLHRRHKKELEEGIEREKAKNRGMTSENLERTVIEMMRDIDSEMKKLSNLVMEARTIADVNSKLMKLNKQRYMERDLLQQECDVSVEKISKNDLKIRKLVEELKLHDRKLNGETSFDNTDIIEEVEEGEARPESEEQTTVSRELESGEEDYHETAPQTPERPDREEMLNKFFTASVDVLCNSIVKILAKLDPRHKDDYIQFHEVFNSLEGRKKELRFLMSKLGNLTFNVDDAGYKIPPVQLQNIEGADEEVTQKKIVEPQRKAIYEFAQPIASDEMPELIATHFFQ